MNLFVLYDLFLEVGIGFFSLSSLTDNNKADVKALFGCYDKNTHSVFFLNSTEDMNLMRHDILSFSLRMAECTVFLKKSLKIK